MCHATASCGCWLDEDVQRLPLTVPDGRVVDVEVARPRGHRARAHVLTIDGNTHSARGIASGTAAEVVALTEPSRRSIRRAIRAEVRDRIRRSPRNAPIDNVV